MEQGFFLKREKNNTQKNSNLLLSLQDRVRKIGFQVNQTFYILNQGNRLCEKSHKFSVTSRYLIKLRLLREPLLESKFQARNHIVCSFITNELPHLQVRQLLLFDDLTVSHFTGEPVNVHFLPLYSLSKNSIFFLRRKTLLSTSLTAWRKVKITNTCFTSKLVYKWVFKSGYGVLLYVQCHKHKENGEQSKAADHITHQTASRRSLNLF